MVLLSKLQTCISFKNENKPFKYIFKRISPYTDPCATTHNNSLRELNVLLILTLCVLFLNELKINLGFFFTKSIGIKFRY